MFSEHFIVLVMVSVTVRMEVSYLNVHEDEPVVMEVTVLIMLLVN